MDAAGIKLKCQHGCSSAATSHFFCNLFLAKHLSMMLKLKNKRPRSRSDNDEQIDFENSSQTALT